MSQDLSYIRVTPGDTLYALMNEVYGAGVATQHRATLVAELQRLNPPLNNPDLIVPGQAIAMPRTWPPVTPPTPADQIVCRVDPVADALNRADPAALSFMGMLDADKVMTSAISGLGEEFTGWVYRAADGAVHDVRKVGLSYYQMKAGTLTRNQYDHRRRVAIGHADARLGSLRQLITPGKRTREVLRVDRHAKVRLHRHIDEIDRLSRIAKVARQGKNAFVVLKVADLGMTGYQIKTAATDEERTVILLDSVASTAGSVGAVALAVFLVGTPTGWLAIAGMAAVGVAGGVTAEIVGKHVQQETLFDEAGVRQKTLLDRIWGKF